MEVTPTAQAHKPLPSTVKPTSPPSTAPNKQVTKPVNKPVTKRKKPTASGENKKTVNNKIPKLSAEALHANSKDFTTLKPVTEAKIDIKCDDPFAFDDTGKWIII